MRAYQDLRAFLRVLEEEHQLLRVTDEVLPEPDLGAAARAVTQLGETSPALYFDKIKGYQSARVVMNVHGSWPNHALALGMNKDAGLKERFFEFAKRYAQFPGEVEFRDDPPWKQVVVDKDVNLFDVMPLFRINRGDGGYYIDKASIVSRDPDDWDNDDAQNVGMYRLEVKGRHRLAIQPVPTHDIAIHLNHAEARNEDLPVLISAGNDPILSLVAGMPIDYNQLEYRMAAVLQGKPYPVVRMKNGLWAPWGSEYVLEGRIIPRKREAEGPFGEFTGHYSGGRNMPTIEIDRVSHRKDPVFEHLYLGQPWTEIDYLLSICTCAAMYAQLKQSFPEVVAVNAIYTHGLVVIVSTKVRLGGLAKAIGLRVFTTPHGLGHAKVVIVVDENVDPFDIKQVMWALATKMNPAGDIVIVPHLSVLPLDPASQPEGMTHKIVIDATTPVPPDKRGNFGQKLDSPQRTDKWRTKLASLLKEV
jgi:4-hydroxybenzoate decarboxylase